MIVRHKDESLNILFEYTEGVIPDGYKAKMKLIKDDFLFEKELDVSEDATSFLLNITTDEMNKLEGNYKLIVLLYNEDIGYGQYILTEILDVKNLV